MLNSVYKDLDNVRDITLPPQEVRPRMPMFKSNYIEPKDSVLSRSEQKQYLKLMQMFKNPVESPNVQSMEDFNLYQSYRELVTQEQMEYEEFAKDLILKEFNNRNEVVTPEARRYAEEKIKCQFDRVQSLPKSYYNILHHNDSMVRMLPMLTEQQTNLPQFEMRLEEPVPVLELGCIPKVILPSYKRMLNIHRPLRLEKSYEKVSKRYPGDHKTCSLGTDPNAVKLAKLIRPDVVIGIKALKAIFANFSSNLNEEWMIPMKVTRIDGRLILFLDSPLINPLAKTPLEKYQMFLRKAAKQLLIKPWHEVVLGDEAEIGKVSPFVIDLKNWPQGGLQNSFALIVSFGKQE